VIVVTKKRLPPPADSKLRLTQVMRRQTLADPALDATADHAAAIALEFRSR
jgi:hypothetical protein